MGILICNGSTLYRRSSSLVRTPISISLAPDSMAFYAVANMYVRQFPHGGFVASASMASVSSAGQSMRNAFLNHTSTEDKPMMWRGVDTNHAPENIFHQGNWAPALASNNELGEAYMQLGGYHFTIPQGLASLGVMGASLQITHGGEICCYQSAQTGKSQNFFGINYPSNFRSSFAGTGWDQSSWTQKVGIWETLNDNAAQMMNSAQAEIELSTGEAIGSPRGGYVRIWSQAESGSATPDGCIPVTTTPYVRTYALPDSFVTFLNQKQHGWIVTIPQVGTSAPAFSPNSSMAYYWLCESHWGYKLLLTLG